GAFGMFATGVGNTDAAFILGTGKIWEKVPKTIKVELNGKMPEYLTAKDLVLYVIGETGTAGATYMALEFTGEAVASMSMNERMTLTNMAIEAGAMNGIIAVDNVTEKYLGRDDLEKIESDPDANYERVISVNVEELEPVLAKPHSPDNRDFVSNFKETEITKAYIGSCTGGKITDYEFAAKVLFGNKVCVPTYIIPSTTNVAEELGLIRYKDKTLQEIFTEAGCIVEKPSCGACLGGPADTVGRSVDKDIVVSTTNRNYPGRMGSRLADVYLVSPLTAAASAVTGKITDPREISGEEK
ncbi:MAG: aconitase family protein, partial [Rhodothermaceae bacterium]